MSSSARFIAVPVGVAMALSFVLLLVRSAAVRCFKAWANGTESRARVFKAIWQPLRWPSVYWCVAMALYLGMAVSDLPVKYVFYVNKTIHVILVFSMSIAAANMMGSMLGTYVQRWNIPISTTALAGGVLKGAVVAIGLLVILDILGISVAPLITALGVGGLAVALALQDTLANLFAGFHILVDKSIRVGDFIRLESGHEGSVDDITWRTARVRTLSGDTVVIPNKKLAQSVVVNYSLPRTEMGITVTVRVGYGADCDVVEAILMEEAKKAVAELPGLVEGQEPSVGFDPGESWVEYGLNLTVKRFVDRYDVQNEMRKRLFRRLRREGIEAPLPARTVYVRDISGGGVGTAT
jgi:small-conductance mechanosensitive channel